MLWCLVASFVSAAAAGVCDQLSEAAVFDENYTGWQCNSSDEMSSYCMCSYNGSEYSCEAQDEELCESGCGHKRCNMPVDWLGSMCGEKLGQIAADAAVDAAAVIPTNLTCADLFASPAQNDTMLRCHEVFGDDAICPPSITSYTSWRSKTEDAEEATRMVRGAALDTMWFYARLSKMSVVKSGLTFPADLLTADVDAYFATFREFSCLRNIPECKNDEPEVRSCQASCHQVTSALRSYLNRCRTYENVTCRGWGYERDCDGTTADYPGLCSTFQLMPTKVTGDSNVVISGSVVSTGRARVAVILTLMALFLWTV